METGILLQAAMINEICPRIVGGEEYYENSEDEHIFQRRLTGCLMSGRMPRLYSWL